MSDLPGGSTKALAGSGSISSGWAAPPRYPTRFVGRRAEVAAIRRLLQPGRLVAVVGLGGAGKTRPVAELVRALLRRTELEPAALRVEYWGCTQG